MGAEMTVMEQQPTDAQPMHSSDWIDQAGEPAMHVSVSVTRDGTLYLETVFVGRYAVFGRHNGPLDAKGSPAAVHEAIERLTRRLGLRPATTAKRRSGGE
jgi:hypothetical protein